MKRPWGLSTLILGGITVAVLALSLPASLREAFDQQGLYVFSCRFFEDIPKRLSGPGRFRFILQPLVALILGIRGGIADARGGRPPYLLGLIASRTLRPDLLKSAFTSIANLLLMGVLLDSATQWLILGASYPGAALVVGPVLVAAPYSLARALANRGVRLWNSVVGVLQPGKPPPAERSREAEAHPVQAENRPPSDG